MKNTNSDLENSLLAYTHAAFIVEIIVEKFHIAGIKMVMLKDFLKCRSYYLHWIERKMIRKASKIDIQLFDKTILRYVSCTNLLLLQCKIRLRVQDILKPNHSCNFTIICCEIWLHGIQQRKHPASYHRIFTSLSIFPTLIPKNKLFTYNMIIVKLILQYT